MATETKNQTEAAAEDAKRPSIADCSTATSYNRTSVPVDWEGEPLITAEMKAQCIGEFKIQHTAQCSACYFDEPEEDCEVCGGEVEYTETITVPWVTCKQIYKAMVTAARRCR